MSKYHNTGNWLILAAGAIALLILLVGAASRTHAGIFCEDEFIAYIHDMERYDMQTLAVTCSKGKRGWNCYPYDFN